MICAACATGDHWDCLNRSSCFCECNSDESLVLPKGPHATDIDGNAIPPESGRHVPHVIDIGGDE